jgi:hypothetical protein
MVAYKYAMPSGIPGDTSRVEHLTSEAQLIDPAHPPIAYGVPVKIVANRVQGFLAGDTVYGVSDTTGLAAGTKPHGFLVRPFPTRDTQDPLFTSTPPSKGIVDVLVRGYIMVQVAFNAASVNKNTQVFVRVANVAHTGAAYVIGQVEGAADAGDCIPVYSAVFTGPADAQGICEVAFNI